MGMRLDLRIRGLKKALKRFDSYRTVLPETIDAQLKNEAEMTVHAIKNRYMSIAQPSNANFTNVFDTVIRKVSGSPLYKSGGLANSVIYKKNKKFDYEVKIDDRKVASWGGSGKKLKMSEIAAMHETGYEMVVTEKMHRFWVAVKMQAGSNQPIYPPKPGTLIIVPARPVWGEVLQERRKDFETAMKESVQNVLYMKGSYKGRIGRVKYDTGSESFTGIPNITR